VSKTPADVVGLTDRGETAAGKRADLIQVHQAGNAVSVRSVWCGGRRVAWPAHWRLSTPQVRSGPGGSRLSLALVEPARTLDRARVLPSEKGLWCFLVA